MFVKKEVNDISFGKRLRELRRSKGISQMELSECIGVSRQTLSKWENDVVLPDAANIICLAEFFDVTTDYLLRGVHPSVDSSSEALARIRNYLYEWLSNRDNWLYIFIVVYLIFLIIVWFLIYEPAPKSFPIG